MPARLENCEKITLPNPGKWKLQGHSKAGERTGFWLEPLNIVLDCGLSTYRMPKALFMTHTHSDHSSCVSSIYDARTTLLKGQENLMGRPLVMLEEYKQLVENFLKARVDMSRAELDYCKTHDENVWKLRRIHPYVVEFNKTYTIDGIENIEVEILEGFHSSKTCGFGFNTISHKLKNEYVEMIRSDKEKFMELKKSKIDMYEKTSTAQLLFYGDTNINALNITDKWKKYPVIIIECTLFDSVSSSQLEEHIHWNDILPYIKINSNIYFILIHTSMSVKEEDLKKIENEYKDVKNFRFIY